MLVLFTFLINSALYLNLKGVFDKKRILVLVFSALISTLTGIYLLRVVDNKILKLAVGIVVVISSTALILGIRIKIKIRILGDIIAGLTSGLLNGSISISGPPVILLLRNEDTDKEVFRKTLTTYFLVLNLISLPMFFISGLFSMEIIKRSLLNLPALGVGMYLGLIIGNGISEGHFKKITLGMIFILGIMSVMSVIM